MNAAVSLSFRMMICSSWYLIRQLASGDGGSRLSVILRRRLRSPAPEGRRLGAGVIHILDRQIELIFVMLGAAAVFRATVGQHPTQLHLLGIEEGHHPIVQQISCGESSLAVVVLGEG